MSSKKNKILLLGIICLLSIILEIVIVVVNNKNEKNISDNNFNQETVSKEEVEKVDEETLIVLSINPKIMLKVKDNTIIEIYQLNDDSIIFTNEKLKGLELEKGIETIINILKENNYIKDDTMVRVSLYNKSKGSQNVISVVKSKFNETNINIESYNINDEEKNEIKNIVSDYEERVKTYTVTFNSNGGNTISPQIIKENNILNKPDNPTKIGYTFLGWYYNNNVFDFNTKVNQDMTIIAQWKEILTEKNIVVQEPISYSTKEVQEVNMLRGTKTVTQTGKTGKKNITYKVVYNSQGQEVSRNKISENIIENPTNEIVKVGISDYNLNTDTIKYGYNGVYCLDKDLISLNGGPGMCIGHFSGYFNSITVNTTTYLYSYSVGQTIREEAVYINANNLIKLNTKMSHIFTGTLNGVNYNFNYLAGDSSPSTIKITQEECNKFNLSCGRW